ncbi:MAG TPA: hypothetical protein DEP64_05120 [Ruminococcaceae bacterium]|jgi:hypothetical protein|nr:hypothetical protein [Oscillospiraceae bacterium]
MKTSKQTKTMACALAAALAGAVLFTACASGGNASSAGSAASSSAPASEASSAAGTSSASGAASGQTLDFSTVLDKFEKGSMKSDHWDRTNVVAADTTTTATIAAPGGEKAPVIMLKGNPGTLDSSGAIQTDPAKNSYYASALLLKDGQPAQYGDGVFKFKEKVTGPQDKVENALVVFRDSAPQKLLSDDAVTKALAIATVGGDVQIQRNYKDSSGKTVKQEVVKDTGVKIGDNKYHYFILALKDDGSSTKVKLWIDGKSAYEGSVDGIAGEGAIQILQNATPMYDAGKKALTTKDHSGKVVPLTACAEAYVGGYDDGPAVADASIG